MRSHLRFASIIGAATLGVIAAAPAMAAAPVAQSGANAINLSVAGNANGSGDATAKNDGTTETKSGQATPPVSVLGGQKLLNLGVLAQEATARANGTSAACAGVAGAGGSVANVGDSSCLNPGDEVNATLGSLDLSNLVLADPASALGGLNDVQKQLLTTLPTPLTAAITSALDQVKAQFGDLGLVAGFGAVEGRCTAQPGSATGDAAITDAQIRVVLPQQANQPDLVLLNLPVHPKPNTHLTTNLSDVIDMVLDAVSTDLDTSLTGALAPLGAAADAIKQNLTPAIRTQVEGNLAPLEQNVLDVVLNRQVRDGDSIKVRALDLTVLPVLQDQLGAALANLQIGNAACGPNGRIVTSAPAAAPAAPKGLPKAVSAGYGTMPAQYADQGGRSTSAIALGAFALLMAGAGGFLTFRRLRG